MKMLPQKNIDDGKRQAGFQRRGDTSEQQPNRSWDLHEAQQEDRIAEIINNEQLYIGNVE